MHAPKILFLCTGASTRSQMAEGFVHRFAGDNLVPVSTGISSGEVSPLATEVMREVGINISRQTPKSVADSLKEHFACVITICDSARERFPIFPFTPNLLRWSLADPATAQASYFAKRQAFRALRNEIEAKTQALLKGTLRVTLKLAAAG